MSEEFYVSITIIASVFMVGLFLLGGCHECEETNRAAIKAGLVQKQIAEAGGTGWSKP